LSPSGLGQKRRESPPPVSAATFPRRYEPRGGFGSTCPLFPRPVEKAHVSFFDPAAADGTDEERMAVFRRVRDEIRDRLVPEVRRRG